MKIKIKHPIIYDGTVLQRGKEYDTDNMKIAEKHVESWEKRRLVKILDKKSDEPKENKTIAPDENKGDQSDKTNEGEFTKEGLEKHTVDELKEIADENDIELESGMKKAEIIQAILEG